MLTLNPIYIHKTHGLNRMLMVFQFEIVFFFKLLVSCSLNVAKDTVQVT